MSEPSSHPWVGTFGSYLLCVKGDSAVTIKRVRYETPVRPVDVDLMVRKVYEDSSVLVSAVGEPPDFVAGDPALELDGVFAPMRAPVRIDRPCGSPRYEHGFTELLFVVKVDQRGGLLDEVRLDYVVDGYPGQYTLELDWRIVLCGNAIGVDAGKAYCADT